MLPPSECLGLVFNRVQTHRSTLCEVKCSTKCGHPFTVFDIINVFRVAVDVMYAPVHNSITSIVKISVAKIRTRGKSSRQYV